MRFNDSVQQSTGAREPIAIVGIGCRFPGADSPRAFWSLLMNGQDAIGPVPPDRFQVDALYDETPGTPGRISTKWGGFLSNLDRFDAQFFGIAPREAAYLDPAQRLLLEVAWESLEDAGIPAGSLAGTRTGVFVGLWLSDFESLMCRSSSVMDVYTATGSGRYSASGRLSFAFDCQGPSMTIDTACSSGLVGVHLACQSLWAGESTLALAGASNVILEPYISIAYSQAGMLAPDGRCKFGDARANGYVRSEGAAIIVLKPLSQAVASGDPIYAVIRGSAVNNNGRSSGYLLRPAQHGHEQMLREAYRHAGVKPSDVQYIEAHGTGTIAGDPVELHALGAVLGEGRDESSPCLVGSVKTNIGHTEAVAGVAGLIKVALALKHGVIPASLHFDEPNPHVPWAALPLAIARVQQPWPDSSQAPIAGVSAFGITGTNAHVVLQAQPQTPFVAGRPDTPRPQLLVLSARSDESLDALTQSYRAMLAHDDGSDSFEALCYWAAARREHHPHRLAVTAADRGSVIANLDAARAGESHPLVGRGRRPVYGAPRVAFVFPGQGGQWLGMGRQLLIQEPMFRDAIAECDAAIRLQVGWSVLDELNADAERSRLQQIDVVQPTIFAVQVALAALWRSWGIEPAAVVGHSMGEVAAAVVAGALTTADAARVICVRSTLMRRASGKGAMGVIGLSCDDTAHALRGFEHRLSIAASNSHRSTVVSGDREALDELFTMLQVREIFCRHVKVDVASHSPHMDSFTDELLASLKGIRPSAPHLPMYSTVTGEPIESAACDGAYWVKNLRHPVLFCAVLEKLMDAGIGAVVEISPHPVLESAINELARDRDSDLAVSVSTRRDQDERESMLAALGSLYTCGCRPEWQRVFRAGAPATLPTYPWQRERFWFDADAAEAQRRGRVVPTGRRVESSINPGTYLWPVEQLDLRADLRESLHLLLDTARELADGASVSLTDVRVEQGESTGPCEVQRVAVREGDGAWIIQVSARRGTEWVVLARGTVRHADSSLRHHEQLLPDGSDPVESVSPGQEDAIEAALDAVCVEAAQLLGLPVRFTGLESGHLAAGGTGVQGRYSLRLTPDGVTAAVDIVADDKSSIAVLRGVTLTVAADDDVARNVVHELTWERLSVADVPPGAAPRATLVIGAQDFVTSEIVDRLRRSGEPTAVVFFGDRSATMAHGQYEVRHPRSWGEVDVAINHWIAGGGPAISRIVYVPNDSPSRRETSGASPVTAALERSLQLGRLVQWLTDTGRSSVVRLWVITGAVWAVPGGTAAAGVEDATVWGVTRTAIREYPDLQCSTVDLAVTGQAGLQACVNLVRSDAPPAEYVVRDSEIFVPRFQRTASEASTAAPSLRDDATYLITGGLGGVATEIATWMVRHGARHLALMTRRTPGTDDRARIATLEAGGASVRVLSADIGDWTAISEAFACMDATMPPLAGIVHAAAVVDDALLANTTAEQFARVLRAKADGAWHLHVLTRHRHLDFFVMCSSIAASMTQPGQGSYAAANTFLDALAWSRRSMGLPAISIQWGLWAGTGLAGRAGTLRSFQDWARQGVGALTAGLGVKALAHALQTQAVCVLAAPINWAQFAASRNGDTARGLFATLLQETNPAPQHETEPSVLDRIRAAAPSEGRSLLRQCLRDQLAHVLRSDVSKIDPARPLGTVGLDSLLTVEFVRRLSTILGVRLGATAVFSFPTLTALEAELAQRLGLIAAPDKNSTPTAATSPQPTPDAISVAAMSEEEAILTLIGNPGAAR